ncbi:DUF2254 family protein [Williamsia sp. 1135]|uniref:DUF2254 family protein n=1 Tax=Williamsia sp. 1135 TaxID=1889262 RepID=UPI000A1094D1|nr:DUF2254 family protein [Williamsia sp. 1135]ORM25882.1 hypothetical protein BFL43_23360 [Williamsia sp. 1135]
MRAVADLGRLITDWARWRRTKRRLGSVRIWRLPVMLIFLAVVMTGVFGAIDNATESETVDTGTMATLLSAIAGGMITLTGLVFTATTLAMQFGATQVSVRVVPVLQQDPIMRWSNGLFLATFVYSLIVASDMASEDNRAPIASGAFALFLAVASAIMFVVLVSKVGRILNSTRLLRWIADEGHRTIKRTFIDASSDPTAGAVAAPAPYGTIDPDAPMTLVRLRRLPSKGRVLVAINLPQLQRLGTRWGVQLDVLPRIGDFVAYEAPLFAVYGDSDDLSEIRQRQLLATMCFGDAHRPAVSPSAALQAIVDVALKALSPAINDPGRAVQAIDHLEDLLLLLAPRVRNDRTLEVLSRVHGYRRTWNDYVSLATDEIRHFSTNTTQVQRRLRALLLTLQASTPPAQHPPLVERLAALDQQVRAEWKTDLDIRLASVADPQGLGSESGSQSPSVGGGPELR